MNDDDEDEVPDLVRIPVDGELDLHFFQPREIAGIVADYLDECRELGIVEVRIVHGKGTGTQRRIVHSVLEKRDDVLRFGAAPPERGGWGATLVDLKPRD